MSRELRRQGVPQNVVSPKFVGDTGKIYNSTYNDFGEIDTHRAGGLIHLGRGLTLDVGTNSVTEGVITVEETIRISGISASDLYNTIKIYGEDSAPAVMKKGYVGVEMVTPPMGEFDPIYMDKVTGIFSGLKEVGFVEVLNVHQIPKWSNSTVTVLYISRGILHKNKETN